MSPGNWVAIILGIVALAYIAAWFDALEHGTSDKRKAFEAERAKADAEALLRAADNEVADRPRVRAISEPLLHRERNL